MYYLRLIMIVVVAVLTAFLSGGGLMKPTSLIDLPSLLLLFLIVLPILLASGAWKSVNAALKMIITGKWNVTLNELKKADHGLQVLMSSFNTAGIFVSICAGVGVLTAVDRADGMEMEVLCANLAVALIPLIYALIFRIILIPLKAMVEQHIIDFMEEDV